MTALGTVVALTQPAVAIAEEGQDSIAIALTMAAKQVEVTTVGDAPNVSTVDDKLFFSGQPTAASLLGFREKGVKTVVNLRTPEEMQTLDYDEGKMAESLGMKYINIPIGREEPSEETIAQLMGTLASSREPMLMHCASSNRVGYIWAIFRATQAGESLETAVEQGKSTGMVSPVLAERASNYIAAKKDK